MNFLHYDGILSYYYITIPTTYNEDILKKIRVDAGNDFYQKFKKKSGANMTSSTVYNL